MQISIDVCINPSIVVSNERPMGTCLVELNYVRSENKITPSHTSTCGCEVNIKYDYVYTNKQANKQIHVPNNCLRM